MGDKECSAQSAAFTGAFPPGLEAEILHVSRTIELALRSPRSIERIELHMTSPDAATIAPEGVSGGEQQGLHVYRALFVNPAQRGFSGYLRLNLADGSVVCSQQLTFPCADLPYLHGDVPLSQQIGHDNWRNFLSTLCNKKGKDVLEVGARQVTGENAVNRGRFDKARYTGFDYMDGNNVDVVGDAHRLSSYFDRKFDLIFSSAVFEHLAMPWIASLEMIRLLKPGGYIFVETHYSFSSHERPWHFFQFSELALRVLFPEKAGIRCIEAGVSNPLVGRFSYLASEYLAGRPVTGLYCHSQFLGVKEREVDDFSWDKATLQDIVADTSYPKPRNTAAAGISCPLKVDDFHAETS